jgi:hypothetical protein
MAAGDDDVSQPSSTLPVVANIPLQPALGPPAISTEPALPASVPPQADDATNIPLPADLPPVNNLVAAPPVNNLVVQPVFELPVNVHGSMLWEEDDWKALSHINVTVYPCPCRIRDTLGE